jgi:hypothetical protein
LDTKLSLHAIYVASLGVWLLFDEAVIFMSMLGFYLAVHTENLVCCDSRGLSLLHLDVVPEWGHLRTSLDLAPGFWLSLALHVVLITVSRWRLCLCSWQEAGEQRDC